MASSLLALLDDITTLLDDVSLMTKVAAKKTAGVLGDDLALNAEQVAGVVAARELPVVWAVAKGSIINKLILVPAALAISHFFPAAITPLLMLGGAFLCFEGFEKIAHKWLHNPDHDKVEHEKLRKAISDPSIDMCQSEKEKIKGAVRTDFILSAEIVVIALGTVAQEVFLKQLLVLSGIALLMTVGVYGLVAAIVKLDDLGFVLQRAKNSASQATGRLILILAPYLMKILSVLGTAAMFLVGGGILAHGFHAMDEFGRQLAEKSGNWGVLIPTLLHFAVGILAGALIVGVVQLAKKFSKKTPMPA